MEIAVIALAVVVISQSIERHFYAKDMTNKLNDAIKAVMSRNINEYLAAVTIPKVVEQQKIDTDEVALSEASDKEFDRYIKEQTK